MTKIFGFLLVLIALLIVLKFEFALLVWILHLFLVWWGLIILIAGLLYLAYRHFVR